MGLGRLRSRSLPITGWLRIGGGCLDRFPEFGFIPATKVVELVPPKEKPFELQWRQQTVDWHELLRHAVVVGVLGFRGKFLPFLRKSAHDWPRPPGQGAVGPHLIQP